MNRGSRRRWEKTWPGVLGIGLVLLVLVGLLSSCSPKFEGRFVPQEGDWFLTVDWIEFRNGMATVSMMGIVFPSVNYAVRGKEVHLTSNEAKIVFTIVDSNTLTCSTFGFAGTYKRKGSEPDDGVFDFFVAHDGGQGERAYGGKTAGALGFCVLEADTSTRTFISQTPPTVYTSSEGTALLTMLVFVKNFGNDSLVVADSYFTLEYGHKKYKAWSLSPLISPFSTRLDPGASGTFPLRYEIPENMDLMTAVIRFRSLGTERVVPALPSLKPE